MTDTHLESEAIATHIVASLERADYPSLGDLYASNAVLDMNLPTWRFQYQGAEKIRSYFHDQTGGLRKLRCTNAAPLPPLTP